MNTDYKREFHWGKDYHDKLEAERQAFFARQEKLVRIRLGIYCGIMILAAIGGIISLFFN